MLIPFIPFKSEDCSLPSAEVFESVAEHNIGILNWEKEFSYRPDVRFRAFHNGKYFFIRYSVNEKETMALETCNGNYVYKDSCVEFFFKPEGEDKYYNFEWNACGVLDMSHRPDRHTSEGAPLDVLDSVLSESSLGKAPLALTENIGPWSLVVAIPASALFGSKIESWAGLRGSANFYKCGDGLPEPHYVSWAEIRTPAPDYHRPEFFKEIVFE